MQGAPISDNYDRDDRDDDRDDRDDDRDDRDDCDDRRSAGSRSEGFANTSKGGAVVPNATIAPSTPKKDVPKRVVSRDHDDDDDDDDNDDRDDD